MLPEPHMAKVPVAIRRALGLVFLLVLAFLGFGYYLESNDHRSAAQRVLDSCQEQFGSEGQGRVNQCAIQIEADALEQRERDKMQAARDHSHL